jgi:hypothetical protein
VSIHADVADTIKESSEPPIWPLPHQRGVLFGTRCYVGNRLAACEG